MCVPGYWSGAMGSATPTTVLTMAYGFGTCGKAADHRIDWGGRCFHLRQRLHERDSRMLDNQTARQLIWQRRSKGLRVRWHCIFFGGRFRGGRTPAPGRARGVREIQKG